MKPLLNLDEISDYEEETDDGAYGEKYAVVGERIGARKLGYSVSVVPPGKKVCPFHNHRINEEMFLVLAGEGTLRFGDEEYPLKRHDIIACPPGGTELAHQILNTSDAELRYLCLSTEEPYDICEFPDSDKIMAKVGTYGDVSFRHVCKRDSAVDYWEGER